LGNPETGAQRLNFAQSFNGLAAALAPAIGVKIILTKGYTSDELNAMSDVARKMALAAEAATVKMPYTILGIVLIVIAIIFACIKLPAINVKQGEAAGSKHVFQAFRHRHLTWGVIAQFFYVGAQVSVFSLFILYAPRAAGISEENAGYYLSACGIAFLIGRFVGSALMQKIKPQLLLAVYAIINLLLCLIAIFASGMITVYAVIGICFFMSVMFPTIFALGIKDLGTDTEYGSSLIIMSIVGGAILPRLFGYISDATGNIQYGYVVPFFCFVVVAVFGLWGHRVYAENLSTKTASAI
jgi:MFS transporter, FHS family, L-fucose permease